MEIDTSPLSKWRVWFWMNYWWNRVFCLFGYHIDRPLPREFAEKWDEPENAGQIICVVCHTFLVD